MSFLNYNPFLNPVILWTSATTQGSKFHNLMCRSCWSFFFAFCLNWLLLRFWSCPMFNIVRKLYVSVLIVFKLCVIFIRFYQIPSIVLPFFLKSMEQRQGESQFLSAQSKPYWKSLCQWLLLWEEITWSQIREPLSSIILIRSSWNISFAWINGIKSPEEKNEKVKGYFFTI